MPLSPPASRTLKPVRRVTYQGFERAAGLWDIEGELHDSKAYDAPLFATLPNSASRARPSTTCGCA